jgi:hypothetical protein
MRQPFCNSDNKILINNLRFNSQITFLQFFITIGEFIMFKYAIIAVVFLLSQLGYAQDTTNIMQLVRDDVQLQKKAILAENLQMTDAQAKEFWKIYNEYQYKLSKIGDRVVDNIEDFAKNYENLTDEKAEDILDNSFDINEEKFELLKDYTKEIAKKIDIKLAARFYQIERLLTTIIDLQVMSQIPLVEHK